jgi:hypothetical protein
MSPSPAAQEVRVHGVGGPQASKILGVLDETDTEVLPPPVLPAPSPPTTPGTAVHLFADSKSRVVARIGEPAIVAYEWGGLTLGSLQNALWVAYLPLTVLNVAGWSQRPGAGRGNRAVVHVLCGLGTLTYIGWLGYVGPPHRAGGRHQLGWSAARPWAVRPHPRWPLVGQPAQRPVLRGGDARPDRRQLERGG